MPDSTVPTLTTAETDADVLEAVARWAWWETHGTECPSHRIPRPADLTVWLNLDECPPPAMAEAGELLAAVAAGRPATDPPPRCWDWRPAPATLGPHLTAWGADTPDSPYGVTLSTANVHRWWRDLPEPRPRHPAAPLVAAWQRWAAVAVVVDRQPRAILPASLRDADRDDARLPVNLDRVTPLGPVREYEQGYLPGLEPPPSLVPPVPWLTLYDLTAVGPIQTRGRGAPLAQRLFVEMLTAVHRADRGPWAVATPVTLRELFAWCWPRYFDAKAGRWRGGYQRNKHLVPLRRALVELDNMRIVHGGWERRLIRVDDLPTEATALDDAVRFHVRHLPGSDRGPMIDRSSARRWGVVSAPVWRATIRLAYLWDEAKRRNNGARVYATRPRALRGPDGVLLGDDGKPLRDRRGATVKDWSDRRTVLLGDDGNPAAGKPPALERNPAADRVPMLGPDDQARLAFTDQLPDNANTRRRWVQMGRAALRAKEAAGEVVIERDHDGWRVVQAWPHLPAPDPDTFER